MDKLIGKMLDNRYEVLEVIGVGGMAIVYKAMCHRLNRYVAIKVMKEEYAGDEEFRKRFFDESQAVAMLSHPNIVGVYDVSRSGDIEYIVMELIDGITLKDYLAHRGALSWKETTFFSVQIAKALEHAHSRGVIHRDIKPQNIMLLRDGTVKVADFGIAHHMSSQVDYSKGEAIGSVHYVSPEQARGSHIDNRSDIYSFGVVMYEMLTGRLPFEGSTPMEVAVQHINSIPLPPSDFVEGIPQALEAITMKAMNPSPSKRYSTAGEMLEDFERFNNDPSVKIEFESPVLPDARENDIDATRKIANPGVVDKTTKKYTPVNEPDDADEDEAGHDGKRRVNPVVFAAVSVLVFLVGAVYFAFKVIDPFGGGGEKVIVPKLEGLEYNEILKDASSEYSDFEIEKTDEVYDDTVDKGLVISQSPEADKKVSEGTKISLVVSLGPKTVTVDDYTGMDGRSVLVILERHGLAPKAQYDFSEEVEDGLVIATSPSKGTTLNSGDSILVRISKGPEVRMTKVPDLDNMTAEEAAKAIKDAKLTPGTTTEIENNTATPGRVVFQSLPANSEVEEGSVINIHICKAPDDNGSSKPNQGNNSGSSGNQGGNQEKPEKPKPEVKDVTIQYVVTMDNIEGEIQVMVAVDAKVGYTANHTYDEGSVIISLTAPEGDHSVTVFQNGRLTKEETVSFK